MFMRGIDFMKIPSMIVMIATTPYVSTRFSPLSPLFSRRVIIIQKKIAKTRGGVFPGIRCESDSPSPIR